jgi:uncharacterized protein (DUF2141 family)
VTQLFPTLRTCIAMLMLVPLAGADVRGQTADRPDGTGTIEVTITGMRNDRGQLLINLFLSADGFPSDPDKAFRATPLEIDGDTVQVVFEDVPAGRFAVSAFHDENENFELDTNFLGMPRERWGVSRGARARFGPPSFDSAVMTLEAGETQTVPVELR